MEISRKRIMGLDFGSKTVGVAITDETRTCIRPLPVIRREKPGKLRKTLSAITELLKEYDCDRIILGLPLNMDGSEGERVRLTREFRELLVKRVNIPVILFDERLTTVEAYEIMKERGIDKKEQLKIVDSVAAEIILNSYIDSGAYYE
jgi:putative Holliday junction resolvase